MAPERSEIEVHAGWISAGPSTRIGVLRAIPVRGKEVFGIELDPAWLATAPTLVLDPGLQPVRGPQYPRSGTESFGVLLDSSPDRWGRVLMQRREALLARAARRPPRRLGDVDYLLGVFDGHRLGGLRYRIGAGPFLDDNEELASPPWASLRELEQASLALEQDGAEDDPKYGAWLRMLIAPGRSLGGARPKASVVDAQGQLWLAKFPSAHDDVDVGGWESVVHGLATRAGVSTAEARRQTFGSRRYTFLTKRFDRSRATGRIHFASAMTMLDRRDGDDGASYVDIAEFLTRSGAHVSRDLEQLWRRVVFNVCVSNVDDHLRNHGFLLEGDAWSLAPAYDMNPNPDGAGLALNISDSDNAQDLGLVTEVAEHFRVKAARAKAIIAEVRAAVATWPAEAKRAKLPRTEQERMAPAFRLAT